MLKHNQCIFLFQSDELYFINQYMYNSGYYRLIAKYNAPTSKNDNIPKDMKTAFFIQWVIEYLPCFV